MKFYNLAKGITKNKLPVWMLSLLWKLYFVSNLDNQFYLGDSVIMGIYFPPQKHLTSSIRSHICITYCLFHQTRVYTSFRPTFYDVESSYSVKLVKRKVTHKGQMVIQNIGTFTLPSGILIRDLRLLV